jgi:hypothetical protein
MHSRGILEHAGYKFHWPNLKTAGADNLNNLETRCSWALKGMTSNSSGDDLIIKKERIDALLEPNVDKTVETPLLWRRGSGLLLGIGNICLCFRRAQKMLSQEILGNIPPVNRRNYQRYKSSRPPVRSNIHSH